MTFDVNPEPESPQGPPLCSRVKAPEVGIILAAEISAQSFCVHIVVGNVVQGPDVG